MKPTEIWLGFFAGLTAIVLAVGAVATIIAATALVSGVSLSLLWNWYAVPFFGARPLSIPMAIGLRIVFGTILGSRGLRSVKEEGWNSFFTNSIAAPLLALLLGWIVRAWL